MAELKFRVSGMTAVVHHKRASPKNEELKPQEVTFIGVDPTVALGDQVPGHHPRLIVNVEYLAAGTEADEIIMVRDGGEHDRFSQFAVWHLSRTRIVFSNLKEEDECRAPKRAMPAKRSPQQENLAYWWEGVEWLADLQVALGQKLYVKSDVVTGKNQLVNVISTFSVGKQTAMMPAPEHRYELHELGKYPDRQAFTDGAQCEVDLAGPLHVDLVPLDDGGSSTSFDCIKGDVVVHMSNLPKVVPESNNQDDFAAYYRLLEGYSSGGPTPTPTFGPTAVDPVFCMLALAYVQE